MNTVAHPAARPASTSLVLSPASLKINAKFDRRLKDHARLWLAALAVVGLPVEAGLDGVEGQFTSHGLVHRIHFRAGDQAVSHARLVGNYHQEKPGLFQPLETGRSVEVQPEILQSSWGEATPVAELRNNNHPIPIEKHGWSHRVGAAYLRLPTLQDWMADQAMRGHGLESLG
jgi:hypothetical protein